MNYDVEVKISLKKGMLKNTQTIDIIKFAVEADSKDDAESQVDEMCQKLLCNPVIHDYEIVICGE